jgi:hypothetical protein
MTAKKFEHYLERYRTAIYKTYAASSYSEAPKEHDAYINFKLPINYYKVVAGEVKTDEPRFMLSNWIFHVYTDAFMGKDEMIIIPRVR